MFSSPLLPLSNQIYTLGISHNLRLFYFASYNMDDSIKPNNLADDFENAKKTFKQFVHASSLIDRNEAINIIKKLGDVDFFEYKELNTEKLASILEDINTHKHFVLVFYPNKTYKIPFLDFTEEELISKIRLSRINYNVHVWVSVNKK